VPATLDRFRGAGIVRRFVIGNALLLCLALLACLLLLHVGSTTAFPLSYVVALLAVAAVGEAAHCRLLARRFGFLLREAWDAVQRAEAANQAKSQFLARMSHEIRTPMYGVLGTAELLQDTALDQRQSHYLATIRRSGEALLSVVNDILDFSKIEAGKMELDAVPFDLQVLVQSTVQIFEEEARQKGLALGLRIAPEVPARVLGDPGRLRQVLINLVGNALKFTTKGSVEVKLAASGAKLELCVVDTGIGIPAEAQAAIFQSFKQAERSTSRRYGGTGLGLAIVSELAALMGGDLTLQSKPGKGSTFSFSFLMPSLPQEEHVRSIPAPAGSPYRAATVRGGAAAGTRGEQGARWPVPRILLVEDNPVNQEVGQAMLESLGCRVLLAGTGRQAVETVRQAPPDLVLMDCELPEMDGLEATRLIRQWEAQKAEGAAFVRRPVPIVAQTANALKDDRLACLAAGADDYLPKPFSREQLRRLLDRHLSAAAVEPDPPDAAAAAPAGSAAGEVISRERLAGMLEMMQSLPGNRGTEVLRRVIDIYLDSSPELLQNLYEAHSTGDAEKLKFAAHSFKSSSANLGAMKLADACRELETLGRAGSVEGARALLVKVEEEYRLVREALQGGTLC